MITWLASSRGWLWNFTPIQPWHSLVPLKLRVATVFANAKNEVLSQRMSERRSMFSENSCSSIACRRGRET